MRHSAQILVHTSDTKTAAALAAAIEVEARDALGGADISVAHEPGTSTLALEVDADDLVHLRAAVNSYLKWVQVADEALHSGAPESQ